MMSQIVRPVGASALRARYSLMSGISPPLPDNQWQLEAEHLTKAMLASLQHAFVEAADGIPESLEVFSQPPGPDRIMAREICANQKIVSDSHSSFNFLGVGLILTVGALIVILDMGLEPTIGWWQRRRYGKHQVQDSECGSDEKLSSSMYGALEWSQTSILQLQRLAHESAGYGEWSGCDKIVPVTERGELLACLDLGDLKHPRLQTKTPSSIPDSEVQVLLYEPWSVEGTNSGRETAVSDVEADNTSKSAVNVHGYVSGEQDEQKTSDLETTTEEAKVENTAKKFGHVHEQRASGLHVEEHLI